MRTRILKPAIAMIMAGIIPLGTASVAHAEDARPSVQDQNSAQEGYQISESQLRKIGTREWNDDIKKLEDQGRIKRVSHSNTPWEESSSYQVNDPRTGDRIGSFTVVQEKKTSERIGGKFDHGIPSVVFNQDDQKALKAGGAAAVAGMAAAWAGALSETVVGSILSAGAISFIGGAAAYYLSKNGICSDDGDLVVNTLGRGHCE